MAAILKKRMNPRYSSAATLLQRQANNETNQRAKSIVNSLSFRKPRKYIAIICEGD